jgi:hypothetical protein
MTFVIWANLDQEARWSGLGIPAHVARRISHAGALLAALAPPDEPVEIWTPADVDPLRLGDAFSFINSRRRRLSFRKGDKGESVPDLVWCDPGAKVVNDRRFARRVFGELPGTRVIESAEQIDGLWPASWVAKAVWSAAGRDRARGERPPTGELRARVANLVARCPVIVEPWLERVRDLGVATFTGEPPPAPHGLLVDARGGFLGIDRREVHQRLDELVAAADRALSAAGYRGPFTLDAIVHDGGIYVCELNARYTFGHVARALGANVLGFGPPLPGARVLVAPAPDDPFTAWVA